MLRSRREMDGTRLEYDVFDRDISCAGRVGAGSLALVEVGLLLRGPTRAPGVKATQDGLEPAVALAVAGRVGTSGGPEARRAVRLDSFPKARHSHVQKR